MDDKIIGRVVNQVLEIKGVRQATKYFSDKEVLNATRKTYGPKGKKRILKGDGVEIVLKWGKPNLAQRQFIKSCKKAKEPFPIKNIQLRYLKIK